MRVLKATCVAFNPAKTKPYKKEIPVCTGLDSRTQRNTQVIPAKARHPRESGDLLLVRFCLHGDSRLRGNDYVKIPANKSSLSQ